MTNGLACSRRRLLSSATAALALGPRATRVAEDQVFDFSQGTVAVAVPWRAESYHSARGPAARC
jgi:hypothetical protein